MTRTPPVVLTIAGFDPSSGAGVTADIKTIAAHDCYGVACITALTVQSTMGVRGIHPVPPVLVSETLSELSQDVTFAAVHVGMLASAGVADAVANFLSKYRPPNIVLDPILKSTSGAILLEGPGLAVLIGRLMLLATVVTPNLHEASIISGLPVATREDMTFAAARLHDMGAKAVVITGGHLEQPCDLLSSGSGAEQLFFESERINSTSTHGTGCAFSTAMACHLAHGRTLTDAVSRAQRYVRAAISKAYPVGKGIGPVDHIYGMTQEE